MYFFPCHFTVEVTRLRWEQVSLLAGDAAGA